MTTLQRRALTNSSENIWVSRIKKQLPNILPPIIALLILLALWQILFWSGVTKLPGPLSIWTEQRTRELLMYPFLDRGGLDKGLFWQTLASLQRVAIGYTAAAI
ncbi:MAG TPA: nitrate ABC transporter, permease protein, partial [Cyanophyceae cyanobacterium]